MGADAKELRARRVRGAPFANVPGGDATRDALSAPIGKRVETRRSFAGDFEIEWRTRLRVADDHHAVHDLDRWEAKFWLGWVGSERRLQQIWDLVAIEVRVGRHLVEPCDPIIGVSRNDEVFDVVGQPVAIDVARGVVRIAAIDRQTASLSRVDPDQLILESRAGKEDVRIRLGEILLPALAAVAPTRLA